MTSEGKKTREMPKGGRKGGTVFPRIPLTHALGYARKLVSKTHTNAQPRDIIYSGVVGAKSGKGNVRISALKQYGFLKGDNKSNYAADDLAKRIAASPDEDLPVLYRISMLSPKVFNSLFETFLGDTVTRARLKQRASELDVHPDETETCIDMYISGMETAGLVSVDGDRVAHVVQEALADRDPIDISEQSTEEHSEDGVSESTGSAASDSQGERGDDSAPRTNNGQTLTAGMQAAPRAIFNVNVTLDSSMDIEKLQKQLELLVTV